ncbi:MAG: hypothetical protein HY287_03210 [Planctomycetes bacterium]|nr:hypothetical protein [Planctomycetota bacterium]MBI3833320.1 hypothetical protein [Planctomycetota bacterium]
MIEVGRPAKCPECAYDLTGLSAKGKCPECGLGYDEESLYFYWRPKIRKGPYYLLLLTFSGGLPVVVRTIRSLRTDGPWNSEETLSVLFAVVVLVLFLWSAWRIRQSIKRGRYAAITTDGLRVRSVQYTKAMPWDQVQHIHVSPFDLTIVDRAGHRILIPVICGPEQDAIVRHLNDRLPAHGEAKHTHQKLPWQR